MPFLNDLDLYGTQWRWHIVAASSENRENDSKVRSAPACCGDGVSLLLYQGACCLGLLVLKFKCTARPPYYLSTFTSHCSEWSRYYNNQRNRKTSALQSLDSLPQSFSDWFANMYLLDQSDVDWRISNEFSYFLLFLDLNDFSQITDSRTFPTK